MKFRRAIRTPSQTVCKRIASSTHNMTTHPKLWAVLLLSCTVEAQPANRAAYVSTVHFHVVDYFGRSLPYKVTQFEDLNSRRDLSSRFDRLTGSGIPHGTYGYQLSRTDRPSTLSSISGEIALRNPEHWVTLSPEGSVGALPSGDEVHMSYHIASDFVIRGLVRPVPKGEGPVWIVLQQLYDKTYNRSAEAKVDSKGEFRIYVPQWGKSLLTVLQGGQVLHVAVVSFDSVRKGAPSQPVVINLPSAPPKVIIPE